MNGSSALSRQNSMLDHERHAERADDAGGVEAEHHQALQAEAAPDLRVGDEGRDDQGVDRDPRRAGHQRRDQDGGQPVALVVDHPRRHDAGDRAGEARQQRDEGAAVQAGAAHDAVHQERGARHVAEVFQQQDEEEQDQDLRQEHQTLPTPEITPSAMKLCSRPAGSTSCDQRAQRVEAASIRSIGGCAQVNTAWNITNSKASRIEQARRPDAAARRRPGRSRCPGRSAG